MLDSPHRWWHLILTTTYESDYDHHSHIRKLRLREVTTFPKVSLLVGDSDSRARALTCFMGKIKVVVYAGGIQSRTQHASRCRRKKTWLKSLSYTSMKNWRRWISCIRLGPACMRNKGRHPASLPFTNCTAEGTCWGEQLSHCQVRRHLGAGGKAPGLRAAHRHVFLEMLNPWVPIAHSAFQPENLWLKIFISE